MEKIIIQKCDFPNVYQFLSYILLGLQIFTEFYIILPTQSRQQQIGFTVVSTITLAILITSFLLTLFIDSLDQTIKQYYQALSQGKSFDSTNYINYCERCCSFVQRSSKHCRKCNRCASGFDHHCKWIDRCIGEREIAIVYIAAVFGLIVFLLDLNLIVFHIWIKLHNLTTYEFILNAREEKTRQIQLAQNVQNEVNNADAPIPIEEEPNNNNTTRIKRIDEEEVSEVCQSRQEDRDQEGGRGELQQVEVNQQIQLDQQKQEQQQQYQNEGSQKVIQNQSMAQSRKSKKSVQQSKSPDILESQHSLPKFLRMSLMFGDKNLEDVIQPSIKGEQQQQIINTPDSKNGHKSPLDKFLASQYVKCQTPQPVIANKLLRPYSSEQKQTAIRSKQQCILLNDPFNISSQNDPILKERIDIFKQQLQDNQQIQSNKQLQGDSKEFVTQSSLEYSRKNIRQQDRLMQLNLWQGSKKTSVETDSTTEHTPTTLIFPLKGLIFKGVNSKDGERKQEIVQNLKITEKISNQLNDPDNSRNLEKNEEEIQIPIQQLDESSQRINQMTSNDHSILETVQFNIPSKINVES